MIPRKQPQGALTEPPAAQKKLGTFCDATAGLIEDAMVRVVKGDRTLDLCLYHWRTHALALTASGWAVGYHS